LFLNNSGLLRVLYIAPFVRVAILHATDLYYASPRPCGNVIYIGYMVEGKDCYEVERVVAVACRRCSDR